MILLGAMTKMIKLNRTESIHGGRTIGANGNEEIKKLKMFVVCGVLDRLSIPWQNRVFNVAGSPKPIMLSLSGKQVVLKLLCHFSREPA